MQAHGMSGRGSQLRLENFPEGGEGSALLIGWLQNSEALTFGDFTLTSGKKSSYYIDLKRALSDPKTLKLIVEVLALYTAGFQRLAGTELGAVPLLVALSLETGLPYVILRKEERSHGMGRSYEGEIQSGDRVLLVEDVATTGGTLRRAVAVLREHGAVVEDAVCVVNREEGADESMKDIGVELSALVGASDLKP